MKIKPQSKSRARVLQALYSWEILGRPSLDEVLSNLFRVTGPEPATEELTEQYLSGITSRVVELDNLMSDAIDNWRLDRVGVIERCILRLGIWELLQSRIPAKGAIDQAVWLAQRFGASDTPAFVNGVLDRVARNLDRL